MQFLMALLEHQVLLVVILLFILGLVGMTYEFILRLFGRNQFLNESTICADDKDDDTPPEPANVPKPPTDPDDELEGAEEIEGVEEVENEDGTTDVEYIYSPNGSSQRLDGVQGLDWVQRHSDMKKAKEEAN